MTLIEELLDIQGSNSIQVSPNSQQVIYATTLTGGHRKGEHETCTIRLADTGFAGSSRKLTSGVYNDNSPIWCPDGKSIAFISDRAKPSEQWAIYVLPISGEGEPYPVTPTENERSIDCYEFSPNGNSIAYISADEKSAKQRAMEEKKDDAKVWGEDWAYNRLRLVDVSLKSVTTLVSRDAHVVDLAWNNDGSKIAFAERKTPHVESQFNYGHTISIYDISSQEIREICTFPNFIDNLTWADDTIYFIGPVSETSAISAQCVFSIDLAAGTLTYVRHAHGEDDCAWAIKKAGTDMVVHVERGLGDQLRMLEGRTLFSRQKEITSWDAAFTTDSDEMILAIAQGDTNSPDEVYTITASGGAMVQLSNHGHAFRDRRFGTAHFLSCQSADDEVSLDAVYLTPANSPWQKPFPTVVYIHGGPYLRVTDYFNPAYFMWTPLLLDAGYGVLLPNYRGSSGRGEAFAAYARGRCGIYDYPDVITLTNHAIEEDFADKDRLLVAGWSQGGFLSFMASVRNGLHTHGWSFKAAIPGAGVSEADTMIITSDIGIVQADFAGVLPWRTDPNDTSGRKGSAIWEFKAAAEKGIVPPMLILHGEEDTRVPVSQSIAFRRALESWGMPFEMVVYPREPHMFKERRHLVDMAERVLKFTNKHIGSGKS